MAGAGVLAFVGDVLCQSIENSNFIFIFSWFYFVEYGRKKEKFNPARSLRLITYGYIFTGIQLHLIYSKILPKLAPGNSMYAIAKKLFLTQTLFTMGSTIMFYFVLSLMENKGMKESWNEVEQKFWPTVVTGWKVWPIV